jgi:hypothetical protein
MADMQQSAQAAMEEVMGLGAVAASAGPYVTIHIPDVKGLVQSKGGALGTFAQGIVPKSIEKSVYAKIQGTIRDGLSKEGITADVQVMDTAPGQPIAASEFLVGAAVGAGTVGVGWVLWRVVRSLIGRK